MVGQGVLRECLLDPEIVPAANQGDRHSARVRWRRRHAGGLEARAFGEQTGERPDKERGAESLCRWLSPSSS